MVRVAGMTFNFSAVPTMTYSLAAKDGDLVRATKEANDVILPALNGAKGAAQIKVSGGDSRQVLVTLDGQKLASRGISAEQVQQALTQMGVPPKVAALYIEMYKAINAGVVAAQEPRSRENTTPTSFEKFVQDVFAPAYHGKATTA